jgi:phosphotransferase system HPr (HPr) family protein
MVQVITLAAQQGSELRIQAEGDDAEQALQALQQLIAANFQVETP